MKITVPASSANLGPGFDSIGLAVSLYLTVTDLGKADEWTVEHDLPGLPTDQSNLIVQSALEVDSNLAPHRIAVDCDIPAARGLGSSSAAIVAGLVLGNELAGRPRTDAELLQMAVADEGHPDNATPAFKGGLAVSAYLPDQFTTIPLTLPTMSLVAFIPHFELKTSKARAALPKTLQYHDAIMASAVGNTLVAALATQNMKAVGRLVESDRFHEPYRASLVPHLKVIRRLGHEQGAYGTYLSGAGPTVMSFCPVDREEGLVTAIKGAQLDGEVKVLRPDLTGVRIT